MRFLFIGLAYPGSQGMRHGSGMGTYLREMAEGLLQKGHSCDVLVWSRTEQKLQREMPAGLASEWVNGVRVHFLPHASWPIVELLAPDSRDVHNVRRLVGKLDATHHYDWIEVESEEGIGIGVQRDYPERTILRIHTTLLQDASCKEVPLTRRVRCRLAREQRACETARRVVTHSLFHAQELRRLFPRLAPVAVIPHGLDVKPRQVAVDNGDESIEHRPMAAREAVFLIIGHADRRKGFDRIRPVLESYAAAHGPCRVVIVSGCDERERVFYGLIPPWPPGVQVEWRSDLTDDQMTESLKEASVLLHLARYESYGMPLLEAAAHGIPIVVTPVGIAPELLQGEFCRFLVNGDDANACADALAGALADRDAAGAALRQKYLQRFTREHMVTKYLAFLENKVSPAAVANRGS